MIGDSSDECSKMNVRSPGVTKPASRRTKKSRRAIQHQAVSYYYDEIEIVVSIAWFQVLTNIINLSKLDIFL